MSIDNDKRLVSTVRGASDPLLDPLAQSTLPERVRPNTYGYGYGYGGTAEPESSINLREYWRIIYKNKWMIATLVLLSTALVSVASFKVDNQYQSDARVEFEDRYQFLTVMDCLVLASIVYY